MSGVYGNLCRMVVACLSQSANMFRPFLDPIWHGPPVPVLATARGGGGTGKLFLLCLYDQPLDWQQIAGCGPKITEIVAGSEVTGRQTFAFGDRGQGAGRSSGWGEVGRGDLGSSLSPLPT